MVNEQMHRFKEHCIVVDEKDRGKRFVYGTRTEKWYLVDETDRDFIHGITIERMQEIGRTKAKEEYLRPRMI